MENNSGQDTGEGFRIEKKNKLKRKYYGSDDREKVRFR